MILVDHYLDSLWKEVFWGSITAGFIGLLAWVRLLRPLERQRHPWEVVSVIAQQGISR